MIKPSIIISSLLLLIAGGLLFFWMIWAEYQQDVNAVENNQELTKQVLLKQVEMLLEENLTMLPEDIETMAAQWTKNFYPVRWYQQENLVYPWTFKGNHQAVTEF